MFAITNSELHLLQITGCVWGQVEWMFPAITHSVLVSYVIVAIFNLKWSCEELFRSIHRLTLKLSTLQLKTSGIKK